MYDFVIGIDPGLRNLGLCVWEASSNRVLFGTVFTTKKDTDVAANEDMTGRLFDVIDFLAAGIGQTRRTGRDPSIICVFESLTYPRSASAAAKLASVYGAALAVARLKNVAITHIAAKDVRHFLGIVKGSDKKAVEQALVESYPEFGTSKVYLSVKGSLRNHLCDAFALIVAYRILSGDCG